MKCEWFILVKNTITFGTLFWKVLLYPSPYPGVTAFELALAHRVYRLPEYVWDEKQETLVERLFGLMIHEEIYALDYNHPAYAYVPGEDHLMVCRDKAQSADLYFPTYHPDGNHYFFVAKDLSFGWFGHPWQKRLILFGDRLLHLLDGYEAQLGLWRNLEFFTARLLTFHSFWCIINRSTL